MSRKLIYTLSVVAIIGLAIFILTLNCWGTVPSNYTGIRTVWDVVQEPPLKEGRYFKVPFSEDLILMSNRVQSIRVAAGVPNATTDQTAETKDQQEIPIFDFTIQYQLLPEKSISIYKAYGENYAAPLVQVNALPLIKEVFASYLSDEIVINKGNIPAQISQKLNAITEPYGIVIRQVIMNSYNFSDEYNKLVEQYAMNMRQLKNNEVTQQNQRIQAQTDYDVKVKAAERDAETQRITAEANKAAAMIEARTQTDTSKIKADSEAYITATKAEAEKKARLAQAEAVKAELEAEAAGLTDLVIQKAFIEKWDGKFVPNFGGSTSAGFTDYTKIIEQYLLTNTNSEK
jgi:regulator of protease activity HflC (stomatin/prohibitin superfamily)